MCKTEQDFPSVEAYNDYLELCEDYVFQLLSDQNIQQVYAELEQFRLENRHVVEKAIRQRVEQERKLTDLIQEESRKRKLFLEEDMVEGERKALEKVRENETLLNELSLSDQPASLLVAKKLKLNTSLRSSSSMKIIQKKDSKAVSKNAFTDSHSTGGALTTPDFNPLQHLYKIKALPDYLVGLEKIIQSDPLLESWIDSPVVLAGGCKASHFHLKAVQCLYYQLT